MLRVGKSSRSLTKRQRDILDFIEQSVLERNYPPSIREIGEAIGLSSSSTVHSHLKSLESKGYLKRNPSKPRGMTLLHSRTWEGKKGCCSVCGEKRGATNHARRWKESAKSLLSRATGLLPRHKPRIIESPVERFLA